MDIQPFTSTLHPPLSRLSVKALIEELEIACPESGSRNWTDI